MSCKKHSWLKPQYYAFLEYLIQQTDRILKNYGQHYVISFFSILKTRVTNIITIDFYPKAAVSIGLPAPMVEESSPVAYKVISNKKIKEEVGILFKEADLMTLLEHWY